MELIHILTTAVAFLVVCMEGESKTVILSSSNRLDHCRGGGNLMRIDTAQCNRPRKGKKQCEAKCDGSGSGDRLARFQIVYVQYGKIKKSCFQFTDGTTGQKYALNVNGTNPVKLVFEQRPCDGTVGGEFLFVENISCRRLFYVHTINRNKMCLAGLCDGSLSLISTNEGRKCRFRKITPP